MAGDPDGLYLIATPVDGATIARAWISQGGPPKFLLNDGMNSADFINSVGAQYLERRLRHLLGHRARPPRPNTSTPTTRRSPAHRSRQPRRPTGPMTPGAHRRPRHRRGGKRRTPPPSATRSTRSRDPDGEPIHAGKAEFAKALDLIKDGKPIRYEGVIGPVSFDQYGDITGPFRLWQIVRRQVTTVGRDVDRRRQRDQGQDRQVEGLAPPAPHLARSRASGSHLPSRPGLASAGEIVRAPEFGRAHATSARGWPGQARP